LITSYATQITTLATVLQYTGLTGGLYTDTDNIGYYTGWIKNAAPLYC